MADILVNFKSNIDELKKSLESLEKDVKKVSKEKVIDTKGATKELNNVKTALKGIETETSKATKAQSNFTTILRNNTRALQQMASEGRDGTAEYNRLFEETAKMRDVQTDISRQQRYAGDFGNVLSGVQKHVNNMSLSLIALSNVLGDDVSPALQNMMKNLTLIGVTLTGANAIWEMREDTGAIGKGIASLNEGILKNVKSIELIDKVHSKTVDNIFKGNDVISVSFSNLAKLLGTSIVSGWLKFANTIKQGLANLISFIGKYFLPLTAAVAALTYGFGKLEEAIKKAASAAKDAFDVSALNRYIDRLKIARDSLQSFTKEVQVQSKTEAAGYIGRVGNKDFQKQLNTLLSQVEYEPDITKRDALIQKWISDYETSVEKAINGDRSWFNSLNMWLFNLWQKAKGNKSLEEDAEELGNSVAAAVQAIAVYSEMLGSKVKDNTTKVKNQQKAIEALTKDTISYQAKVAGMQGNANLPTELQNIEQIRGGIQELVMRYNALYEARKEAIVNKADNETINKFTTEMNELAGTIETYNSALFQAIQDENAFNNAMYEMTGNEYFDALSKGANEYRSELELLNEQYKAGVLSQEQFERQTKMLTKAFQDQNKELKKTEDERIKGLIDSYNELNSEIHSFMDSPETQIRKNYAGQRNNLNSQADTLRMNGVNVDTIDTDWELQRSEANELVRESISAAQSIDTAYGVGFASIATAYKTLMENMAFMTKEDLKAAWQEVGQLAINAMNGAMSSVQGITQQYFNNLQSDLENRETLEYKHLENLQKQGVITQEDYDAKRAALDEKYQREKGELAIKQFNFEKAINIASATMQGAQAVLAALTLGFPMGPIMAGIAAALAGVQIGLIAAQQPPRYEQGGYIFGASHKSGGVQLEAEGGEFITNKKATAEFGSLLFLMNDYMRKHNTIPATSYNNYSNGGDVVVYVKDIERVTDRYNNNKKIQTKI